jgi:hypothetical protein
MFFDVAQRVEVRELYARMRAGRKHPRVVAVAVSTDGVPDEFSPFDLRRDENGAFDIRTGNQEERNSRSPQH